MVVAYRHTDNLVYVGYSLCNTVVDKFDKQIGLNKAVTRAEVIDKVNSTDLPQSVRESVENMKERANRFFNKGK